MIMHDLNDRGREKKLRCQISYRINLGASFLENNHDEVLKETKII